MLRHDNKEPCAAEIRRTPWGTWGPAGWGAAADGSLDGPPPPGPAGGPFFAAADANPLIPAPRREVLQGAAALDALAMGRAGRPGPGRSRAPGSSRPAGPSGRRPRSTRPPPPPSGPPPSGPAGGPHDRQERQPVHQGRPGPPGGPGPRRFLPAGAARLAEALVVVGELPPRPPLDRGPPSLRTAGRLASGGTTALHPVCRSPGPPRPGSRRPPSEGPPPLAAARPGVGGAPAPPPPRTRGRRGRPHHLTEGRPSARAAAALLALLFAPAGAHHDPPPPEVLGRRLRPPPRRRPGRAGPRRPGRPGALGRPADGRLSWSLLRSEALRLWRDLHPAAEEAHQARR